MLVREGFFHLHRYDLIDECSLSLGKVCFAELARGGELARSEKERYLPSEKQMKIAPAIEYISNNYNKNVTNDELAAIVGLSTVYFRKLFTEITGISPIAYLHKLRIEKAKQMLRSDYGSLSDMAQSLGYSSLYDFSRDFKKHTGKPPSKY